VFGEQGHIEYIRDYSGSFVYTDGAIDFILTEEGRVNNKPEGFIYEYFLKDHLGNTRVSFEADDGTINTTGETHYYPFGMTLHGLNQPLRHHRDPIKSQYLYNGKELQSDNGLEWYDYGARFYDAQLGRWWSVDPLTALIPDWSPYRYALNNPINIIDPDGQLEDWYQSGGGDMIWQDENKKELNIKGGIYKNVGKSTSLEMINGKYVNYYENVPISISGVPMDATSTIHNNQNLKSKLLSKNSPLSVNAQTDLLQASIKQVTGKAAKLMVETAMFVAPMPKIGVGTKLAGRTLKWTKNASTEVYVNLGIRGNRFINVGKNEMIKQSSRIYSGKSFGIRRKMVETDIPQSLKRLFNKEIDIAFDPKYQKAGVKILGKLLNKF